MVATQETIKKEKLQLISWSGDQVGGQVMDRFSIVMLFFPGSFFYCFLSNDLFFDRFFFKFLDFFRSWILGITTIHIFPPLKSVDFPTTLLRSPCGRLKLPILIQKTDFLCEKLRVKLQKLFFLLSISTLLLLLDQIRKLSDSMCDDDF